MQPILRSQQQQIVNGAKPPVTGHVPDIKRTHSGHRPRGRDVADSAIRLRVYLAKELRRQAQEADLDVDQYSSGAVTALCIALERQGVRGIEADSDCDVVTT